MVIINSPVRSDQLAPKLHTNAYYFALVCAWYVFPAWGYRLGYSQLHIKTIDLDTNG